MKRVCIRCDASRSIGTGHTSRCLTLGRELKKRKTEVLFICKEDDGDINEIIKKEFEIRTIRRGIKSKESRDFQDVWTKEIQIMDAMETIACIKSWTIEDCDWIVVDSYGLDKEWEVYIKNRLNKKNSIKILVIDDLANRKHLADILVDQNYMGEIRNNRYSELVSKSCKQLIGPNYAILGEEYDGGDKVMKSRDNIKKILVYFGGSDKEGWTRKILKVLSNKEFRNWEVDIVTGIQDLNLDIYKNDKYNLEKRIKIYKHQKSLAGLIAEADLGIGAGGTTNWERIALGLYTLVITMAENQEEIAKALHEEGYIGLLGKSNEVTEKNIVKALKEIKDGRWPPAKMQSLVNTNGRRYIATAMMGIEGSINLRKVIQEDMGELLRLANEERVRKFSIQKDRIDRASHERWFKDSMKSKDRIIWIIQDKQGLILGQIRFDQNNENKRIEIDISIDKSVEAMGLQVKQSRKD